MRKRALALLAGLALVPWVQAQTSGEHEIVLDIPNAFAIEIDNARFIFDFTHPNAAFVPGFGSLTLGGPYQRASLPALLDFIRYVQPNTDWTFAPTRVEQNGAPTPDNLSAQVRVTTGVNGSWTIRVASISGNFGPLPVSRARYFVDDITSSGNVTQVQTATGMYLAPLQLNAPLINGSSTGIGQAQFSLYYGFALEANDSFPSGGIQGTVTVTLEGITL